MNSLSARVRAWSDRIAQAAGIDVRLLGMILVLVAIWVVLHLLTGGLFLNARNLFNLSLQVAVVGIMTCGMVLVIVSRHIDLSVGSQIGFIGVFGAVAAELSACHRRRVYLVDHVPRHARAGIADRSSAGSARRLWRGFRPSW